MGDVDLIVAEGSDLTGTSASVVVAEVGHLCLTKRWSINMTIDHSNILLNM